MHDLLEKLFRKRNIKDATQLDDEEKVVFENWQKILSKEEMTIDDIKHFCQSQIEVIEGKWKDYTVAQYQKAEYIPYHTVYKTILQAIDSPKVARESLEKQLIELTK